MTGVMRLVGGVAVVLLAGCHAQRVADLRQRIDALKGEAAALSADAAELRAKLDALPPPTASIRMDNDPPGFDASLPLPAGDPARPDVILLSIDTLRADHLSTYGYKRPTSPVIDALGADGTVFEQAWSPTSWTLPSHTTMLSGMLPIHHGTIDDHLRIAADIPLVQEAFARSGYRTKGVVSTLFVSSRFGFERGFGQFEDFGIRSKKQNNLSTVDADHVFHHALDWAQKEQPGQPMFLFLHVYDAHYQYDPPSPWNEKFDRKPEWGDEAYKDYFAYKGRMLSAVQLEHQIAQYDEEIAFIDAMFGEFLDKWRASGRRAIVAVTADHGEEFGERGSWGHAHTLWPEQLHVPFVVSGPGVVSQRVSERVGTEDIAPTLAALAGVPFTARDGVSRAGTLRGTGDPDVPADHVAGLFADTSRFDTIAYRWHEGAYDLQVDVAEGVRSLCKLDEDPTCAVNAYREHRPEAEELFGHMMAYLGTPWKALAQGTVEVRDGILYIGADRANEMSSVSPETPFLVVPGDALVRFTRDDGVKSGPWRPLGGSVPGARCPVTFDGRFTVNTELPELSVSDTAMLEALGYLQAAPEEDPEPVGPSGRVDCP